MEFRVLGPLEVLDQGRRVPLGGSRQQGVLALLLLHANEVVASERLIEELWGERPPSTARKALQIYVSQLRRLMGGNGDAIVTRNAGYVLTVDRRRLDATRFEDLVAEGRNQAAAGRLEAAALRFRDALALWRGPAVAGLAFDSYARGYVERLDEERLVAMMDRIDCELALGRHEQLVGELESLVAQHPLRERLRSQLMLALYRSGRQADALQAYRQARAELTEELGLEPSAGLQRLERAILVQDPALELPGGVAQTAPAPAAADAGAEPSWPRWPRRRLLAFVAGAALTALAATAAALVWTGGSEPSLASLRPGTVGRIDPERNALVAELPAAGAPSALVSAFGRLWAASDRERTVASIDPSGTPLTTIVTGLQGSTIAPSDGSIWVGSSLESSLGKLDPERGVTTTRVNDVRVSALASGAGALWTAGLTHIARIDPQRAVVTWRGTADFGANAIAVSGGTVWVGGDAAVVPFDARRLAFGRPIATAGFARAMAVGGGAVWVAIRLQRADGLAELARIDPATRSVTMTVDVDDEPSAIAVAFGSVWVASSFEKTVQRFDSRTGEEQARIELGATPSGLAVTDDAVWVSVR